jgi:trehalose synthase
MARIHPPVPDDHVARERLAVQRREEVGLMSAPGSSARPSGRSTVRARTQRVEVRRKTVEAYRRVVGDEEIARIRDLASTLRGLRVLELSSTATGGGVAELLASLVPLQRDLGLDVEWRLIVGDRKFYEVTKRLHNGLQGMAVGLRPDEREEYLHHNAGCAAALRGSWDLVVVHDPQPAAVLSQGDDHGARWIWRCHIDSSEPDPEVWRFLRPFLGAYDRLVFTMDAFVPPDVDVPVTLIAPAIDPLSSKNRELPTYLARETVAELGVDLARPLMIQVSRFDPWKDPLGVVETWRRARSEFPTLQLALVGAMAGDDPEGWRVYREIERVTRGEPDCLLLSNQIGVNAHEVNALQRVADVAVQKSIREGFGLVVSETLWKGTPMVAGRTGGIPLQLRDGETGRLATSVEEFATAVCELLRDPDEARAAGLRGRQAIAERFLITRLLREQLELFASVLSTPPHRGSQQTSG